jgi:hypothetical protein
MINRTLSGLQDPVIFCGKIQRNKILEMENGRNSG